MSKSETDRQMIGGGGATGGEQQMLEGWPALQANGYRIVGLINGDNVFYRVGITAVKTHFEKSKSLACRERRMRCTRLR